MTSGECEFAIGALPKFIFQIKDDSRRFVEYSDRLIASPKTGRDLFAAQRVHHGMYEWGVFDDDGFGTTAQLAEIAEP